MTQQKMWKCHKKFLVFTLCACAGSLQAESRRAIVPADCVAVRHFLEDDFRSSIQTNSRGTAVAYLVQAPNLQSNQNDSLSVRPTFKEVKSTAHALEFTAHGFGIALLPRSSAAHISYPGIVFKPLADRYLGIETVLFMRRDQRYGKLKEVADGFLSQLLALRIRIN